MKKILCEGGFLCKFIYVIPVQLFSHEIDSFMRFVSLFLCLQSLYGSIMNMHKGTVSWDFWSFLLLKRFDLATWAPNEQAKMVLRIFFIFTKIFDCKVWKSCVHVVIHFTDMQFFYKQRFSLFLNYCYTLLHVVMHPSNFFCLIVPLKSVRSLQSFHKVSV